MIAKSEAVLGTFTLPLLQKSFGAPSVMIILALCCLVAALITYFFGIETQGLPLESVNEPHV